MSNIRYSFCETSQIILDVIDPSIQPAQNYSLEEMKSRRDSVRDIIINRIVMYQIVSVKILSKLREIEREIHQFEHIFTISK